MSYLNISNLYKPEAQDILMFRECYALEKIHGTSAHITIDPTKGVSYFSGGVSHKRFVETVEPSIILSLADGADVPNDIEFTVYGEAYGGSCMKMSAVYGPELRFVVFDVKVGDIWLNVPNAHDVANKLGLEFVDYRLIPATLAAIDAERDRSSVQSARNGVNNVEWKEGVVLRPTQEFIKSNGKRLICKHKRDEHRETKAKRVVSDAELKVLSDAREVATEWVTEMRLIHLLDKIDGSTDMTIIPKLLPAMIEDIKREGDGEIEWNKQTSTAITRATAQALKVYLQKELAANA